jgi:lipopolysaccharide/colanic/teichoic acid biosynthesis glycosyltransferase
MLSGRGYRVGSVAGVVVLTVGALAVANARPIQEALTTYVPLVRRLQPDVLAGEAFAFGALVTLLVVGVAVAPLYKPRRILNVVYHAQRRIVVAGLALSTLGYFDYSYRLPRGVLLVAVGLLLVVLPAWFVAIRRRPDGSGDRTLIVGDDIAEIRRVYEALEDEPAGYVGPPSARADGGVVVGGQEEAVERIGEQGRVGGLSRLGAVIEDYEVDTAAFAFSETDREEFFGALGTCHDHGVDAVIRREKADSVLVSGDPGQELLEIDVEPWDWQERMVERVFDVCFVACGLAVLSPVILVIAIAVKLEDGGSVLYGQVRTAELGEIFTVYKFRSMVENAEAESGAKLSEEDNGGRDPRVTRVGRLLRQTHLDEIPQLWSILVGDMSVVGPRPERPVLDGEIEAEVLRWRQRWFVKPGLTGLAQINDATGYDPAEKLRYDVDYIRRQSLRFDVGIVVRQVWAVLQDIAEMPSR